jgi:hypothetical protein
VTTETTQVRFPPASGAWSVDDWQPIASLDELAETLVEVSIHSDNRLASWDLIAPEVKETWTIRLWPAMTDQTTPH